MVGRNESAQGMAVAAGRRTAPREHGAWGILLVPFVVGAIAAGRFSPATALLLVSAVSLFLLRARAAAAVRAHRSGRRLPQLPRLLVRDALLCGLATVPLILVYARPWLLPLGAVAAALLGVDLWLMGRRQEKSLIGEWLGAAGLCLTGPAAYHVGGGPEGSLAVLLWGLCFAYFALAILYVRMRIGRRLRHLPVDEARWRLRQGAPTVAAHLGVLAVLVALVIAGRLTTLAVVAFLPAMLRAAYYTAACRGRFDVRRLGWTEMLHSLLFAAILASALHR